MLNIEINVNSAYTHKNKIIISQPSYSSSRSWWPEPIRAALGTGWTAALDRTAFHRRANSASYSGRDSVDTPVNPTLLSAVKERREPAENPRRRGENADSTRTGALARNQLFACFFSHQH